MTKKLRFHIPLWLLLICLFLTSVNLTAAQNQQPSYAAVAWSPNGNLIAEGRSNGFLVIRSSTTGNILSTLQGAVGTVNTIDWSPDSTKIVVGDDSSGIKVWNTNGQLLTTMSTYASPIFSVAWSPDGTRIAGISTLEYLSVWNAATYQILDESRIGYSGSLSWSPDGAKLAFVHYINGLFVIPSNPNQLTQDLWYYFLGDEEPKSGVIWSPDGTKLALADGDNFNIDIVNATTAQPLLTLSGNTGEVTSMVWSAVSNRTASASRDGTIRIWDEVTGNQLQLVQVGVPLYSVDFNPAGTSFVYNNGTGITITNVTGGEPTATHTLTVTSTIVQTSASDVAQIGWNADDTKIATHYIDGSISVLSISDGYTDVIRLGQSANGFAWHPTSPHILAVGVSISMRESKVFILDTSTSPHQVENEYEAGEIVLDLVWKNDAELIATSSASTDVASMRLGEIRIWNLPLEQIFYKREVPTLTSFDWSESRGVITGITGSGEVVNLNTTTWQATTIYEFDPVGSFDSVAWSPDQSVLAVGRAGEDQNLRIWDPDSEITQMWVNDHNVRELDWSQDGRRLAGVWAVAAPTDYVIKVFDVATGNLIESINIGAARTFAWSNIGNHIAFAGANGEVTIVDVPSQFEAFTTPTPQPMRPSDPLYDLKWSPDGTKIALATGAGIIISDATNGQVLTNILVPPLGISSIEWSPDGEKIAGASWDSNLNIWNAINGQLLQILNAFNKQIQSIAWSIDGSQIFASAGLYDFTLAWNTSTYRLAGTYPWGRDIAVSPDGTQLALAVSHGVVIQNLTNSQYSLVLDQNQAEVESVSWKPDGTMIASVGYDGTVRTWNLITNQPILVLEATGVTGFGNIVWLPNDHLSSVGFDEVVRVWNASSGEVLFVSTTLPYTVSWSPDGTQLAVANPDGSIQITIPTFELSATSTRPRRLTDNKSHYPRLG